MCCRASCERRPGEGHRERAAPDHDGRGSVEIELAWKVVLLVAPVALEGAEIFEIIHLGLVPRRPGHDVHAEVGTV